jgi:uncharacterized protein YdaU (DUF1376 family)
VEFYRKYPGDYRSKTARLSLAEHGAYNLLLDESYATESPLPTDEAECFRICAALNQTEQEAVRRVLDMFFPVVGGVRVNKRAAEQLPIEQHRRHVAKSNGKNGGRPPMFPVKQKPEETKHETKPATKEETKPATQKQTCLNPVPNTEEKKPPDGGADDPKALMWKTGVAVLKAHGAKNEDAARAFLGQFVKDNEAKLAEVIAYLAAHPKVEPKAYIVAAMTGGAKATRAAAEAFAEVRQRIRDGRAPGGWTHPQTEAALEAVGGWQAMRGANSRDNDFRERPFVAAFTQTAAQAAAGIA